MSRLSFLQTQYSVSPASDNKTLSLCLCWFDTSSSCSRGFTPLFSLMLFSFRSFWLRLQSPRTMSQLLGLFRLSITKRDMLTTLRVLLPRSTEDTLPVPRFLTVNTAPVQQVSERTTDWWWNVQNSPHTEDIKYLPSTYLLPHRTRMFQFDSMILKLTQRRTHFHNIFWFVDTWVLTRHFSTWIHNRNKSNLLGSQRRVWIHMIHVDVRTYRNRSFSHIHHL